MSLNVPALVVIVVLYVFILILGIWAGYRQRKKGNEKASEIMMVARRDIGYVVGTMSLIASWVGGGVINGTAEMIYAPGAGFLWSMTPYVLGPGMLVTALIVVKKLRRSRYVSVLDPLQNKHGNFMGALFYLPTTFAELCYTATILSALGSTIAIVVDVDMTVTIVVSTCIAVAYTLIGGFYSVAYTDVAQLILMVFGLYLALPFAMTNSAVSSISVTAYEIPSTNQTGWLGEWDSSCTATYLDNLFLWLVAPVSWQALHQRIFSTNSVQTGFAVCIMGSIGLSIFVIPPVLFGATAVSTDWNMTSYGLPTPMERNETAYILPIVLQHLTPAPVAVIGLAAICTAVMSSTDAMLLSNATVFVNNVYSRLFRKTAFDAEKLWVMRLIIVLFGAGACVMAIFATSIFGLLALSNDILYVLVFPQLMSVMYLDVNTYGALPAFIIGTVLRLGAGEPSFGMSPFIHYPYGRELFPFRTFAMLVSAILLISISYLMRFLFANGYLDRKFDILKCNLADGGRKRDKSNRNAKEVDGVSNDVFTMEEKN